MAGDFDGDGFADIFAVQNSYAPYSVVGHFDGGIGQLLRGDGRGHFEPVRPAESGLVVPGDAQGLVICDLDFDGWPDFLVSRNRSALLAWRNPGAAGRRSMQIRLQGAPGNRDAIGARVTVELTEGKTQTSEVSAGGGVGSQSTTALFFGYPPESPPRRIRVRWPSGVMTMQEGEKPVAQVVISAPARRAPTRAGADLQASPE